MAPSKNRKDKSKNISSVTYTWFNKPQTVTLAGSTIYYTYDAGGNKLQEVVQAGSQGNTTNYISGAVYKNGVLNYISTAQGRTNMVPATPRQEYFVKDHLGNIRSTVASTTTRANEPLSYRAGYEAEDEVAEEAQFDKVAELRADKPGSLSSSDQKAAVLQDNQRLGTSIMLKVMAGDKVDINADNFYESLQHSNSNNEAPAALLFEQVIGGLAGGSGALSSTEGGSPNALTERILSNPEAVTAYEDLLAAETDSTRPKAFLNFLFFDEELNLLPEHSRIWQTDGENSWSRIGSEEYTSLEMPQNGYIVSYLSNQSGQEAWFDNMNVALSNGMLLEEHHYYAYGLPIAGFSSLAANATPNRQRYQGNEYIESAGLEWMDFHNRQYDPQLGRFLSVDPLEDVGGQQVLSPYHAMGCNPVSMVDPLGLQYFAPATPIVVQDPGAALRASMPTLMMHMPGGSLWGLSNMSRYISSLPKDLKAEAWMLYLSGGNSSSFGHAYDRYLWQKDMRALRNERENAEYNNESILLPTLYVSANRPAWTEWAQRMTEQFGTSLGYSFGGYGLQSGEKKFFFEFGAEVTAGLQVGGGISVGELNAGLKANLVNVKLLEYKTTQTGSDNAPWIYKLDWIGKKDKYTVASGVDLFGVASYEQSFDKKIGQTGYINESYHHKFSLGPFTYHSNPEEGTYIQIELKAALILGVSGSFKFGLR